MRAGEVKLRVDPRGASALSGWGEGGGGSESAPPGGSCEPFRLSDVVDVAVVVVLYVW